MEGMVNVEQLRGEISFLSNIYYDCAEMLNKVGCRDREMINNQFRGLIDKAVRYNKVSKDGMECFEKVLNELDLVITEVCKRDFVKHMLRLFDKQMQVGLDINKLYSSFMSMMDEMKLGLGKRQVNIIFINFLETVLDTGTVKISDKEYNQILHRLGVGSKRIRWGIPMVVISTDGCSGTQWGSALRSRGIG